MKTRPSGKPPFDLQTARDFLDRVRSGVPPARVHCRGFLYYEGLPWRGELWLDDDLRLGPPTQQYTEALLGPRVIMVDAMASSPGRQALHAVKASLMSDVRAFLSVVLRTNLRVLSHSERVWVHDWEDQQGWQCRTAQLGYIERAIPMRRPTKGEHPPIPLVPVQRPDLDQGGIGLEQSEETAPEDILDLWKTFSKLPQEARRRFLEVAKTWQLAVASAAEHPTASASLLVVGCEALKPLGHRDEKRAAQVSFLNVVEGLLGPDVATRVQSFSAHEKGPGSAREKRARITAWSAHGSREPRRVRSQVRSTS